MNQGIIVFGHGSRLASANDAVRAVAARAAAAGRWTLWETAFLEADPRLSDAIEKLVAAGAASILITPYFLTLGMHLERDLPALVLEAQRQFSIPIRVTPPLDGHEALSRILVERAEAAG